MIGLQHLQVSVDHRNLISTVTLLFYGGDILYFNSNLRPMPKLGQASKEIVQDLLMSHLRTIIQMTIKCCSLIKIIQSN